MMGIDKEKQARAIRNAQKIIKEAEQKRASTPGFKSNVGINIGNHIEKFGLDDFKILQSDESSKVLSNFILAIFYEKGLEGIKPYFEKLKVAICHTDKAIRSNAVMTVALISNGLHDIENVDLKLMILYVFVDWLKVEEDHINGAGIICKQIQELGLHFLQIEKWREAEPLFVTLYQIQNGIVEKNSSIHGLIVKIQENLASTSNLQMLTEAYLSEVHNKKDDAENLLTYMGRRSVIYLINRLIHSEKKQERLLLIKLIPYAGNTAVPVLVDCINKQPPWFVLRNIIFIISEIGDTSLFSLIRPFLSHTDIRVQHQVVSCIAKFGGNRMESRLLEALPLLNDEIKTQLVMELGQMKGSDVEGALIDLLEKRSTFSERTYDNLVRKLCISLKFFPSEKSFAVLQDLIEELLKRNDYENELLMIAQESLSVIEPKLRHLRKAVNTDLDYISFDEDPTDESVKQSKVQSIIDRATSLIEDDDMEEACQLLFNQVRITAREKDFATAEFLRDKLLEVNPMALSEVIEAGEIIEEEKNTSISSHHLTIWNDLYEQMTTEEFNAMYYAMNLQNYNVNEPIVKVGETDSSLYFINSGFVSLSCSIGTEDIFLKRLQPGDIIGVGQFFSVSVWTYSLKAQSGCQISVLERNSFENLLDTHTELETKLEQFCRKFNVVPELVKMIGGDRRDFPRYPVSIIVNSILLDPYGNPGKRSFKGEMLDISKGGLCFSIHISSKENARLLLGRQIITEIKTGQAGTLKCTGIIVGVKYQEENQQDFSIHVKFNSILQQAQVIQVINLVV